MDATTFRTCAHTGLRVHLTAERLIKVHAVAGVLAILFGGIAALGVLLTRWPAVHLLEPATIRTKPAQPTRGQATRLPSTIGATKYRIAISKKMIQKISMLMPWNVSAR